MVHRLWTQILYAGTIFGPEHDDPRVPPKFETFGKFRNKGWVPPYRMSHTFLPKMTSQVLEKRSYVVMALISTFFELNKNCKAYASSTPGSQSTIIFFILWYICKTKLRSGFSIGFSNLNISSNLKNDQDDYPKKPIIRSCWWPMLFITENVLTMFIQYFFWPT